MPHTSSTQIFCGGAEVNLITDAELGLTRIEIHPALRDPRPSTLAGETRASGRSRRGEERDPRRNGRRGLAARQAPRPARAWHELQCEQLLLEPREWEFWTAGRGSFLRAAPASQRHALLSSALACVLLTLPFVFAWTSARRVRMGVGRR